ncbi:hypothetical protein F4778DRAFT_798746 [Xylariomycetidae sp. FL2044]|nr:hypothetical protein F4778DRAFT_798746 [Xylariomycetidae sp. FL2044]
MTHDTAEAQFGRRLLPHVVDDLARKKPDQECFSIPRTSNPKDGWKSITFKAYARAIDALAHKISEKCGQPARDAFPTLAYIGPNDARYVVLFIAAMKAGYKALFVSPRNSHEAQMSLFDATGCDLLCFPDSHRAVVAPWLQERRMQTMVMDSLEDCFETLDAPHFPYDRTFEETEWLPAVVLHTSGSTGLPKPFVVKHGFLAKFDAYHDLPEWNGCRTFTQVWSEIPEGLFAPVPFFHAGGLYLFMSRAIYWGNPMSFGVADRPLSPDLVLECLGNLKVEAALLPPVILEYMSKSSDAIKSLLPLKMVAFGGGELAKYAGDELAKQGVKLVNAIAATEFNFLINSEIIAIDWRLVDGYDDLYRLVFARNDVHAHPGYQTCFYTFQDDEELDSKDLFKPHPTLPKDYWLYCGRADNIIVLSNGEKLNPVSIENDLERHPLLKGALVVGSGRFQTALLIEPAKPPADEQEAGELIASIWPTVALANEETVAHGRIGKEFIMICDPQKPLPRGGKGTVQRANANKLYKDEIDQLYAAAGGNNSALDTFSIDLSSKPAFSESIREAFRSHLGSKTLLELDTDFYTAGIDSLQVINVSRRLKAGLVAAGLAHVAERVSIGEIYRHQTPRRLGAYLYSLAFRDGRIVPIDAKEQELRAMEVSWRKHTQSLPGPKPDRPTALTQGQTVLLTGSTGMLGSYMLHRLLSDPQVSHIHCLNRTEGGGPEKQRQAMAQRGLSADFSKCTFHQADMSRRDFSLGPDVYEKLRQTTDRVFLVAWPVNFNLAFGSFEPHIRGVRHMADFASETAKRADVVFISTIDTCDGWDPARGPVPEARVEDLTLPSTGYGRSKLVAGLVLEDAARAAEFPATVIRVGQVAGSEDEGGHQGVWNRHEWIPSIVASSLYLEVLPGDLGQKTRVDWLPVEKVVDAIFDVAGAGGGYFHAVNPQPTTWTELAPAIQELYGKERIPEIVSFEDWVARLEASGQEADGARAVERNPALKLLDLSRTISASRGREPVVFSTSRTAERSPALREVTRVTGEMMVRWCEQWGF